MATSKSAQQLEQLCDRFEIAVENFGRSCVGLRANEAAFQAWYAASVIHEFGMSRVYREIHLAKGSGDGDLLDGWNEDDKERLPKGIKTGNELFPDLCVSREPNIDARHSSTRDAWAARKMLENLAIVTEFKATGSTKSSTPRSHVKTDLIKLGVFAKCRGSASALATYMVILDNSDSSQKFTKEYMQGLLDEVGKEFPVLALPTVLVFGKDAGWCKTSV